MKMTIESTDKIVEVNGVPARIWQGTSERGITVIAYITSIAAAGDADLAELEADLQEHAPPTALDVYAWPTRVHIDHDSGDQIRTEREAFLP